ncbi:DUF6427 family protein [Taibaiella soli]|nr:DUF6427 family protein [Taibaiella soli]
MLQLVRNNSPFTVLILFIFTLLIKMQVLLHPVAPVALPGYYLYNHLLSFLNIFLGNGAFAYTLLGIIMLFGQSLYLTAITTRHRLFYKPTYIPAFCYLLVTSVTPAFSYFSSAMVVSWLLLMAIDTMLFFPQSVNPRKYIFNAGFFCALAALFQFSAIAFVLLLIMALILLRSFTLGEWMVGLLGVFTPIYLWAGILFLNDQLPQFKDWVQVGISLPKQIHNPVYLLGTFAAMSILIASGFYVMQGQMPKSTINVRRSWGVITSGWIISSIAAAFTGSEVSAAWLISLPAVALVIAQPMYLEKSKRFSNFIFYFSLLMVFFCQIAIK